MDNPAALHRIRVGVPATVEHSSEAGPETGKWIAETTQVGVLFGFFSLSNYWYSEFHHIYGCIETSAARKGSATPYHAGARYGIC
jgi:hypothetical protein